MMEYISQYKSDFDQIHTIFEDWGLGYPLMLEIVMGALISGSLTTVSVYWYISAIANLLFGKPQPQLASSIQLGLDSLEDQIMSSLFVQF